MRALIRRYPFTPTKKEQDEIFIEKNWPYWVNNENYGHLTDENLGYALCENCPILEKYDIEDFEIIENVITKYENNKKIDIKTWTAYYNPKR